MDNYNVQQEKNCVEKGRDVFWCALCIEAHPDFCHDALFLTFHSLFLPPW